MALGIAAALIVISWMAVMGDTEGVPASALTWKAFGALRFAVLSAGPSRRNQRENQLGLVFWRRHLKTI